MRSISPSRVIPALFTRISTLPNRSRTALAQALIDSSLATSSAKAAALPAGRSFNLRNRLGQLAFIRAASATVAPARASSSAQARPIPCDAPVTRAIRPSKFAMSLGMPFSRQL